MWGVGLMLALFFGSTAAAAFGRQIHPPSHIETINPKTALSDSRFSPQGVAVDDAGRVHARILGMMFAWMPAELTLPGNTRVTFHITSTDVTHGFEIVRTNGQAMALPGYISQFTTQFAPGEYLIACNEYCGVGHHVPLPGVTLGQPANRLVVAYIWVAVMAFGVAALIHVTFRAQLVGFNADPNRTAEA